MVKASCGCEEGTAGVVHQPSCPHYGVGFVSSVLGIPWEVKDHGSWELPSGVKFKVRTYELDPMTLGILHTLIMHEYWLGQLDMITYNPISTRGLVEKVLKRFYDGGNEALAEILVERVSKEIGQ